MNLYQTYVAKMHKIADVNHAIAVLGWDQEVHLPEKGAHHRAQQIATLAGMVHEMAVSAELEDLLGKLSEDESLTFEQQRNIAETKKHIDRRKKLPVNFVVQLTKAVSATYQAWMKARSANHGEGDFTLFSPQLKQLVDLKREETTCIGYADHPYDALIDEFEPGEKTADLTVLFADVRRQLVDFVKEIHHQPQVEDHWMFEHYDKDRQWHFGLELLKQMGYDFKAGRQDISAHPFTTSFSMHDVRVTTRINEHDLHEMIWGCLHEGGHALYEQGLLPDNYGLPSGSYVSLGIHESQSRLWENNVGRSLPYWKANYAQLQAQFPERLANVPLEAFYKSMNKVNPSLIRTNADELTYHFHILVRFEIEKALIEGSVEVNDLRELWNQKYKEYLDVTVPNDRKGVLQDIHWSHGSFGYFATYSLGSFYAAQFFHQASKDIPYLQTLIEHGNLQPLLQWLRTNIHQYGQLYPAEELCKRITGEKLNFKYFMEYARQKYSFIYNLR